MQTTAEFSNNPRQFERFLRGTIVILSNCSLNYKMFFNPWADSLDTIEKVL